MVLRDFNALLDGFEVSIIVHFLMLWIVEVVSVHVRFFRLKFIDSLIIDVLSSHTLLSVSHCHHCCYNRGEFHVDSLYSLFG